MATTMKVNRILEKACPHHRFINQVSLAYFGLTASVALASLLPVLDNADIVCEPL
jgi:hypothetical protein